MKTKDNFTPWKQFDSYRGKEFNGEWPTIKELFHINTLRYGDNVCWKEYSPKEITYKEGQGAFQLSSISGSEEGRQDHCQRQEQRCLGHHLHRCPVRRLYCGSP